MALKTFKSGRSQKNAPVGLPQRVDPLLFHTWHIDQVYRGPEHSTVTEQYIVNVNDLVVDWNEGFYQVTQVDAATGRPTLTLRHAFNQAPVNSVSYQHEDHRQYRIYVEAYHPQPRFYIDQRFVVYGGQIKYAVIYYFNEKTQKEEAISYDAQARQKEYQAFIPLKPVFFENRLHRDLLRIQEAQLTRPIDSGKQVKVKYFSEQYQCLGEDTLIVVQESVDLQMMQKVPEVRDLKILSPFMNIENPTCLRIPYGTEHFPDTLQVQLWFGNGNTVTLDQNDPQLFIHGWGDLSEEPTSVVVSYYPHYKEDQQDLDKPLDHFSKCFKVALIKTPQCYELRARIYPQWVDAVKGYRLVGYLYRADRLKFYDITAYLDRASFKPTYYEGSQTIECTLPLHRLDASYPAIGVPIQTTLSLKAYKPGHGLAWWEGTSKDQPQGPHQPIARISQIRSHHYHVDISAGLDEVDPWLQQFYYTQKPMMIEGVETYPPKPTHLSIQTKHHQTLIPLEEFNQWITVKDRLAPGDLVVVHFVLVLNKSTRYISSTAFTVDV